MPLKYFSTAFRIVKMDISLRSGFNQSTILESGLAPRALQNLALSLEIIGFGALSGAVEANALASLKREAAQRRAGARLVYGTKPCLHSACLAGLGNAGFEFLHGRLIQNVLYALFNEPLELEEGASCYTYYSAGDCQGPHLDHPRQCAVTVILYVDVRTPARKAADTGLQLRILENDDGGPGPIRAALRTELGGILVGLGSEHWHERPRLRAGERLTALTACFSLRP